MTESLEDYLEIISLLADRGKKRVTDIALEMGVSKPSVFGAIKVLAEGNLVKHERYGEIELTKKGKQRADKIQEKHWFLTDFLHKVIGVSLENAEKDACKMEHILSDETLIKLKEITKNLPAELTPPQK
jgi:DtxR family Mn-dependent transcriptional regulator